MEKYLPYIATVLCSVISGLASFFAARRQAKSEIQKLQKQHELNLETEREKFKLEKEKMELDHKYQMEQKLMEMSGHIGGDFFSTVVESFMNSPAGQAYVQEAVNKKCSKK